MNTNDHATVRANDLAVVVSALGEHQWVCWDSVLMGTRNTSSWYVKIDGTKFWAFVNNGVLTSTSLIGV